MKDGLERLQRFYASQCNGDWEHHFGVTIDTLDNPGWSIRVSIEETSFAPLELPLKKIERSENDWIFIAAKTDERGTSIECTCGPLNLIEALDLVLSHLE